MNLSIYSRMEERAFKKVVVESRRSPLLAKKTVMRLIREAAEESAEIEGLTDDLSAQIDNQLSSVMQQVAQKVQSAGAGEKKSEIGAVALLLSFPAFVELCAKLIKVIGLGIRKVVSAAAGKKEKKNVVEEIGEAIEHWVEHSILKNGYYKAIGYLLKAIFEGAAKTALKAAKAGKAPSAVKDFAERLLSESEKTDYVKLGSWVFKAISIIAISNGLKEAVEEWETISKSVVKTMHFATDVFETLTNSDDAADLAEDLLGAAGTSFVVIKLYKQIKGKVKEWEKVKEEPGEEKGNDEQETPH